jgi:hypothetical protein
VAKLAKFDFNAARTNIISDFHMVWNSVKETRGAEVEDQSVTPVLIGSQLLSLFLTLLHHFSQEEREQYGFDIIADKCLRLFRNSVDLYMQSLSSRCLRK